MKRKTLLLALVLILALVLSACGCDHTWTEATCETAKTCTLCGKTEGKALGHSWQEASCAAPKTCAGCGMTEGAALEHSWQEASCAAPKTCTVCGLTEGEALPHNWELSTNCYNCGTGMCEVLGHDYSSWTVSGENMLRSCDVCGAEDSAELDYEVMLMDNLQGSWHPELLSYNGMDLPAGMLENTLINVQVDKDGNIRLITGTGADGIVEGIVSFRSAETADGQLSIYAQADFGEGGSMALILISAEEDVLLFAVNDIAFFSTKMEKYVDYFAGNWASPDGALTMTLNADGTFTADLEGEISGIWQPRPYYEKYGCQRASIILSYQVDGEETAMTLSVYMGMTAEEAEDRMKTGQKPQIEYYGENIDDLLNYVGD